MSDSNDNIRYMNVKKVASTERAKVIWMVIAGMHLFFYGFGFIGCLFGEIDPASKGPALILSSMFIIISVLFIIYALKLGKRADAVRRYEMIFGADEDGIVTVDELSTQMGKPGYKIFKELEGLFKKGYFSNCNLQQGGKPCVIINNAMIDGAQGVGFINVQCPNCAGVNRIRVGSYGQCTFCGNQIVGKA